MKKLVLLLALVLTACTDPKGAVRALDDLGMTDVSTGGYAVFACSKDDFYHTSFVAKNPQGKIIKGTVCSGLVFKNSTVRFQ